MSERDQHKELWFFVPDYPAVRARLEEAYHRFIVHEHSAEPSYGGGDDDDSADVIITGDPNCIARFWNWLVDSNIPGLMIEGQEIRRSV